MNKFLVALGIYMMTMTASCLAYPLYFRFSHVPAKEGFHQPEAGSVYAHVYAFNTNLVGTPVHKGTTPEAGLLLGSTSTDHSLDRFLIAQDPFGKYTINISCRGSKQFANQKTTIRKIFYVPKREGIALKVDVSCPSNDLGTTLIAPLVNISAGN
jgi:hypothetical protein